MTNEEKAFLDVIAYAEGTLGVSNNGYDVLLDFYLIPNWNDNYDKTHQGDAWRLRKNAAPAGRYQFQPGSWREITGDLPFNKKNQDDAAIKYVKQRLKVTQLKNLNREQFYSALVKLQNVWVSFKVKKKEKLWEIYQAALKIYNGG
jgi:muramidase (phage lysozyme)